MINRLSSIFESTKGIFFFLVLLLLITVLGYNTIDFLSSEETIRFQTQLWFSRILIVGLTIICLLALFRKWGEISNGIQRSQIDIAVFRILFFGFFTVGFIFTGEKLYQETINFIQIPFNPNSAPNFLSWLPELLPFDKTLVTIFIFLFGISSLTSLFGIKTKWSILIFSISLFYLFAIPNFYGKVNHNHHILWFALILGFGRSGDTLSFDRWISNKKGKPDNKSQVNYSQPFIILWTLIGIIYFFPGFWKVWNTGFDWALSDNMRDQLHLKWFQLGDWLPIFRLDQHPILYKSTGLFTIYFELLFLPFILFKRTRRVAIISGLIFHLGTLIFMNIFFVILVLGYSTFIPWSKIFKKTGPNDTTKFSTNLQLKYIGGFLIIGNIIFGIAQINSWPLTCYPTFASIASPVQSEIVIIDGRTDKPLDKEILRDQFDSARLWNIEQDLIQNSEHNSQSLDFYNQLLNSYYPEVTDYKVCIQKTFISPEKKSEKDLKIIYTSPN